MISICVPVYNAEKYIRRCALSLFNQTYNRIEYVFVDDKSTDNSVEVLNKLLNEYPNRKEYTKIISHDENKGVAATRNTAISNASGDYVMWVDADDYIEENAVELLVERQKLSNADFITFDSLYVYNNKVVPFINSEFTSNVDFINKVFTRKTNFAIWGRLIDRKLFVENDLRFNEGCNAGEDFLMVVKLGSFAKKLDTLSQCLYHYDCSINTSLTKAFSTNKMTQLLSNLDECKAFLMETENWYLVSSTFYYRYLSFIARMMHRCASHDNQEEYYEMLYDKAHKNDCGIYIKEIPLKLRIQLAIKNYNISKFIARLYESII